MFNKAIKQTGLALFAAATLSFGASMVTGSTAEAAPLMKMNEIAQTQLAGAGAAAGAVTEIGYKRARRHRGGYRRHGRRWGGHRYHRRHYARHYYKDCFYKRRKVWSNYYGYYIYKKVRVCY